MLEQVDWIEEFDYKQFFDRVNLAYLSKEILDELQLPKSLKEDPFDAMVKNNAKQYGLFNRSNVLI